MNVENAVVNLLLLEGIQIEDVAGDSGGLTKNGETQASYDAYRTLKGLPLQSVALMTNEEMYDDYNIQYWEPAGCALLPPGLDFIHFQWAVNHGVVSALRCLKTALFERPQLGDLNGPLTATDASYAYQWGSMGIVEERYLAIQSATYDRISQIIGAGGVQTELKFFNGWENRIQRVRDIIAGRALSV